MLLHAEKQPTAYCIRFKEEETQDPTIRLKKRDIQDISIRLKDGEAQDISIRLKEGETQDTSDEDEIRPVDNSEWSLIEPERIALGGDCAGMILL